MVDLGARRRVAGGDARRAQPSGAGDQRVEAEHGQRMRARQGVVAAAAVCENQGSVLHQVSSVAPNKGE